MTRRPRPRRGRRHRILPAPADLQASATTDTTATLSWDAPDSAASYTVYRDGAKTGTTTSTHSTDTGLTAGTAHTYTVAAVDPTGTAGTATSAATATGGFTPANSGGYVYGVGSNRAMGLYNVFATHTTEETAPGHYTVADTEAVGNRAHHSPGRADRSAPAPCIRYACCLPMQAEWACV
ncbi:fibronectin type III domain-containing protein [Streptomyces sp. NRRL F-5126]|uniref:fibronectin type III domain-containing protein n=1 Tax=Streptomyces sp. NRRL F-5126 TaxID=1463857 RepID=UPI0004CB663B